MQYYSWAKVFIEGSHTPDCMGDPRNLFLTKREGDLHFLLVLSNSLPPLLLLLALGCHHTAAQSGVQSRIVTGAPVDKERDVEEVDPGLLQDHYNVTGRPASRQFNGGFSGTNNNILPGSSGSDFPSNTNFIPPYPEQGVGFGPGQGVGFGPGQGNGYRPGQGTGFGPGQGTGFGSGQGTGFGSGQGTGFGTGQGVGFGPGQGVGFGPGQVPGVFPGESGQGVLPGPPGQGASNLPPGSVSADTVAFTATRASSFTRNGISQVRFDFTVTDVGYGWLADRSEFSCYYPGLYYFTFNGLSSQNRQFK